MISNTEKGNKSNGQLKDVKLVLESNLMVQDVSDKKNDHSASLQNHQAHGYGISP
jgi:hypothetical protein